MRKPGDKRRGNYRLTPRVAAMLRVDPDLPSREIAAELGIPLSTAKSVRYQATVLNRKKATP